MPQRVAAFALMISAAGAAISCGARAAPDSAGESSTHREVVADSVVGLVEVVGAEPATVVEVTTRDGQRVVVEGDQADLLRSVGGVSAAVYGTRPRPNAIAAVRFEVRAANGVPAVDGVLMERGGVLQVVTAAGERIAVRDAPAALRTALGQRVWISGNLSNAPDAFGIITPFR